MAIKNYTSDIGVERIFTQLQQTLGQHSAKRISFDYGDDGTVAGLSFVISVEGRAGRSRAQATVGGGGDLA